MTPKEFIKLQSKLGLNIVKTGDINWVIADNNIAINTPSLETIDGNSKYISEVLSKGAKAALFIVDSDNPPNSAEYLFKGNSYTLEGFKGKIRNQIKKGLKSCTIKKPACKDLQSYGLKINQEILNKQNRDVKYLTNSEYWANYSKTLLNTNDVYCYAAYIKEELVGYVFFIKVCDKYYIYHPYSTREFSKYAPMNAILYTAINNFIETDGSVIVTYGLASFYSKPSLDHFKKGMLFSQDSICRALVIPLYYKIVINKFGLLLIKKLARFTVFNSICNKYDVIYSAHTIYQNTLKR